VNPENITISLAFIVGLISFVSPCVLPLVPAYIGYMGGRVTNTVATHVGITGDNGQVALRPSFNLRFNTAAHGVFFVAGFTFVFVTIGLLSTAFVQQVGGRNINLVTGIIGRLGGVLIIFFGLHFSGLLPRFFRWLVADKRWLGSPITSVVMVILGVVLLLWGFGGSLSPSFYTIIPTTAGEITQVNWPTFLALIIAVLYVLWLVLNGAFTRPLDFWGSVINRTQMLLYMDTRRQMNGQGGQGYAGSALMGVVFSAGWTPCIGPVYGTILTVAANTGNVGYALPLLTAYCLGLGIPFVVTALLLDGAQGVLRRLQRHMHKIELVSGAFLIIIGVLVASGQMQSLSQYLAGAYADFSVEMEEQVVNSLTGANSGTVIIAPTPAAGLNSITGAAENMDAPVSGTAIGNIAPDFSSVLDTGEAVRLSDLRGQVVLLNFWATWCGPCRVEMPEFEKAYENYKDQGFTILGVNNAETQTQVAAFRQEMGVSFPFVMDEQATIQRQFSVISYPSTYILNRDGEIIARQFGPLTAEQIESLVAEALAS